MAVDRTLVLIRERSMVDVLDLALVVARREAGRLGLAALIGIAPFAALNAGLCWAIPDDAPGIALLAWLAEAPFATAPLTVALGALMFGQTPRPGKVLATISRSAFPLLVVHGISRYLLFWWAASRLAFANEILLLERGRWWKVFGRGNDLASGRGGELILLGFFQVGLTYVFASVFSAGATLGRQAILAERLTWEVTGDSALSGWAFQSAIWLVTAFFAVARFLAYIDQRIRLEGWEVELRLRGVGEAMAEARRW